LEPGTEATRKISSRIRGAMNLITGQLIQAAPVMTDFLERFQQRVKSDRLYQIGVRAQFVSHIDILIVLG
jgi:hypothetical protein